MKFHIKTLGCKVNQSESDNLAFQLTKRGLSQTKESAQADLVILNTCTVTSTADSKSRQMVSKAIKSTKGKVIVTGCAVNNPDSGLNKFSDGVEFIKQEEKSKLKTIVGAGLKPAPTSADRTPRTKRSRPFLRIQDGCGHSCSYCIVPLIRGPSKSLSYSVIQARAKELLREGYKELVLTGVDIGAYKDNGRNLKGLISDLLALQADFRIRLSSIEPQSLTDEFLSYFAGERRMCSHIHLPLQSGNNRVLKMMNRPYRREYFQKLVEEIKKKRLDIALTTDIIVGFPGETAEYFEETMSLVKEVGFPRIHIFPYSSRPGVKAENMPGQIEVGVKKERAKQLKTLAEELSAQFKKSQIGKATEVLVECPEGKHLKGISSNYLTIYGDGAPIPPAGQLIKAKITKFKDGRLFGKIKV